MVVIVNAIKVAFCSFSQSVAYPQFILSFFEVSHSTDSSSSPSSCFTPAAAVTSFVVCLEGEMMFLVEVNAASADEDLLLAKTNPF